MPEDKHLIGLNRTQFLLSAILFAVLQDIPSILFPLQCKSSYVQEQELSLKSDSKYFKIITH